jgi:hypothetical protein
MASENDRAGSVRADGDDDVGLESSYATVTTSDTRLDLDVKIDRLFWLGLEV